MKLSLTVVKTIVLPYKLYYSWKCVPVLKLTVGWNSIFLFYLFFLFLSFLFLKTSQGSCTRGGVCLRLFL